MPPLKRRVRICRQARKWYDLPTPTEPRAALARALYLSSFMEFVGFLRFQSPFFPVELPAVGHEATYRLGTRAGFLSIRVIRYRENEIHVHSVVPEKAHENAVDF